MLSVLPKEYEEYVIDDKEVCSVCGSDFNKCRQTVCPDRSGIPTGKTDCQNRFIVRLKKCTSCGTDGSGELKDHLSESGRAGKCCPIP